MLRHLEVVNYGLIDQVSLDFSKGLTAITGETGSGKSILLGAFGLLLGERADSKAIKHAQQKCIVEAIFSLSGYALEDFFQQNDLDFDEQTTIRREIAPGGKSRAFINDTPVSLQVLKALGERLVDIHSQHENSIISDRVFQFGVLDIFAKQQALVAEYAQLFSTYKKQKEQLAELKANEAKMKQDLDYYSFQLEELSKIDLSALDQQALEEEQSTLENAGNIKSTLLNISTGIEGDDDSVLLRLQTLKSGLQKLSHLNKSLEEFYQRLDSNIIELKEISRDLEAYAEAVSLDPERMDEVQHLLGSLFHLQQKHRLTTVDELIVLRNELEQKVDACSTVDDAIEQITASLQETERLLGLLSAQLTSGRIQAAQIVQNEASEYFKALSLEHATLHFEIQPSATFHALGADDVQLLFRANKGGSLLPIKQVASGGEMSRVMLALKAVISKHKKLPVLILDEIDQGVSGEVGKKIGKILKDISDEMQLITITHLPQIAGQAQHHLKVFKETDDASTTTKVTALNQEHRLKEIAEMLSGKNITKAALENAKELMN